MPKNSKEESTSNSDKTQDVRIRASQEALKGSYTNIANIRHTDNEFIIDYFLHLGDDAELVSRIITNPKHYKKLVGAMSENLNRYEEKNGEIKLDS